MYFEPAIQGLVVHLDDVFDFVTQDDHRPWVTDALEAAEWPILQKLAGNLTKYGPDVLLTEQWDKCRSYRNLILVLGYIDGPTDTYLAKLLSKPLAHRRILRCVQRRSSSANRVAGRAATLRTVCWTSCRSAPWEAGRLQSRWSYPRGSGSP